MVDRIYSAEFLTDDLNWRCRSEYWRTYRRRVSRFSNLTLTGLRTEFVVFFCDTLSLSDPSFAPEMFITALAGVGRVATQLPCTAEATQSFPH
jgi:hypothetical protein